MFQRLVNFTCLLVSSSALAACGQTTSPAAEDAAGGAGGTGGSSSSGGASSGTGGFLLEPSGPEECNPTLDASCRVTRVVRSDIQGTLPGDATLPPLTRGECGSSSQIELVAEGLGDLPSFAFASMPTENAPDALYFLHGASDEVHCSVGRIAKSDCAYDASFRGPSDLPRAAATHTHLLWRPALGAIDAAFHWDALDGSSSESLPFAGGRPVGANGAQVFLSEEKSPGPLQIEVFDGKSRQALATVDADEVHIFGRSAIAYTIGTLLRQSSGGYWVDLDTGGAVYFGETSFFDSGTAAWEAAVIFESALYYCNEGLVRAERSGKSDVRIIDTPCTSVVHADSTGVYWMTPNGLARAALDGSSPTLIAPGGDLFDDTHIYFFEGADLMRMKRE